MENVPESVDIGEFGYENETLHQPPSWEETYYSWFIFTYVLLVGASIVSIACSIFIVHVILKFPKLKTRVNFYLMHLLICHIIVTLVAPFFAPLYFPIFNTKYVDTDIMLVAWYLKQAALILIFIYATVLGFDWVAKIFDVKALIMLQNKCYKFMIFSFYILAAMKICLCVTIDVTSVRYRVSNCIHIMIQIFYFIAILIVTIFNIMKYCRVSLQPLYSLQVANVVIYSWLPNFVYTSSNPLLSNRLIVTLTFIPPTIFCCVPFLIIMVLKFNNNYFRTAFAVVLGRKADIFETNQLRFCEEH